jgi:phosphopantetheinyl transferase (holo-ACP synthase)
MIGNDIIDISVTKRKTDWKRRGFIDKIFSAEEQNIIGEAADPFLKVWRLWSIKEAAYKLNMRYDMSRKLNPSKINCELYNHHAAVVYIKERKYYAYTLMSHDYIYSYATENEDNKSQHYIIKKNDVETNDQITSCRTSLISEISKKLNVDKNEIDIRKTENGQPHVFHLNNKINLNISLTHHGLFSAYSIM